MAEGHGEHPEREHPVEDSAAASAPPAPGASEQPSARATGRAAHMMAIVSAETGRFLEVNETFVETLGYRRSEILSGELLAEDLNERRDDFATMRRRLREDRSVQGIGARLRTRSGDAVDVVLSAFAMDLRGESYIAMIAVDIAEREKLEERRRAAEHRLGKAFVACPYPMYIIAVAEDRFIEVNEALEEVTGYDRDELCSGAVRGSDLWVSLEERDEFRRAVIESGSAHEHECRFKKKSGE